MAVRDVRGSGGQGYLTWLIGSFEFASAAAETSLASLSEPERLVILILVGNGLRSRAFCGVFASGAIAGNHSESNR